MNIDKRFAKIAKDARYKKIPRKERKVKIDSRFKSMFTERKFKTKYHIDKRGRPMMQSSKEDLERFYEMEDDDEDKIIDDSGTLKIESQDKKPETQQEEESNSESDGDIDFSDIRGGMGNSSSDDEDVEEEEDSQVIEHNWGELDKDVPRKEDAVTSKLAACNLDWDRVTADDLFVLFSSLGGTIKSVKIFLSEFGKQRLAEEDLNGPEELLNDGSDNRDGDDEDFDDGDDDEGGDGDDDDDDPNNLEGSKFHLEKLRKYQLNRLKYYYAVVDCDSKQTANKIYDEYDGMEYELSATRLDLRFIPEDMEFEDKPKSVCTQAPLLGNFRPSTFINTALQQSTVRSTWDEPDQKRLSVTMRKFDKDELLDMDFKAYLASSSDEDEVEAVNESTVKNLNGNDSKEKESEDQTVEKYRALLKEIEAKEHKDDDEQHMEISWAPGLSETADKIIKDKIEKEEEKSMTPWEKYQKERKKKKKERKEIGKRGQEDDSEEEQNSEEDEHEQNDSEKEDLGFNHPFFTEDFDMEDDNKNRKISKKKKKGTLDDENDEKSKNELELLLMDGKEEKQHFNMKSIMANEKKKKKKNKNRDELSRKNAEDDFEINVQDTRFDALFTSHNYAPDPSDPQFRKTKAMDKILEEKQRRRKENKNKPILDTAVENSGEDKRNIDPSLSALIKTVKSRTEQFQKRKKNKLS